MSKAQLRLEALACLRLVTSEERLAWSGQIRDTLTRLTLWKTSPCVLLYAPLKNEPDLLPLLELPPACRPRLCFPRVHEGGMDFWEVEHASQLVAGATFLRSPDASRCRPVQLQEIPLAVLPGLAFDPVSLLRLGRGGGYYDRLLAEGSCRATAIGVCFSLQLRHGLPGEPHDIPMQRLLTESNPASGLPEMESCPPLPPPPK